MKEGKRKTERDAFSLYLRAFALERIIINTVLGCIESALDRHALYLYIYTTNIGEQEKMKLPNKIKQIYI